MVLTTWVALALSGSDINAYPYLKKRVPRPEKKELVIKSTIEPREFNKKADAYQRCMDDGKNDKECRHLLGPTYHFNFEILPH